MKRQSNGLPNLDDLDPAVAAAIGDGQRRQAEARLPKGERKQRIKDKQHSDDRKGMRATYDLPPVLINALSDLAKENQTTASQLAALAISEFLSRVETEIHIEDYKIPIHNPRYSFLISLDKLPHKPN